MEQQRGIWFGLAAYVFWGLTPIFWNLVTTDAGSLLLHRIVWSVPILLLIVTERHQWRVFTRGYATWRPRLTTVAAAVLLTINWGTYVWAVTNGHIVEASLGYFINPLVSVALGVMVLKKRDVTPPPVVSLFGETLVLFMPALLILLFVNEPTGATFGSSPATTAFFVGAGLVTVIPLLLFGAAAKRIPLSSLGFLQYIAPTIQLIVGVVVFRESISGAEMVGFVAVWTALTLFSVDRSRHRMATR
jgi:chloramphenicol-sensitive protein RarD